MCNHQSELDIFALLASLNIPVKWMAKKELFTLPFLAELPPVNPNNPNNAFILNNPLTKSSFCSRIDMSHTTNPMQKEEQKYAQGFYHNDLGEQSKNCFF